MFPLPDGFPGGDPGRGACNRRCSCELVIGPAATTSSMRRTGIAVETRPPAIAPGDRGSLSVGTVLAARASPRGGNEEGFSTPPVAGAEPASERRTAEPPGPAAVEPGPAVTGPAVTGPAEGTEELSTVAVESALYGRGVHQRGGRIRPSPVARTVAAAPAASARRIAGARPVPATNRSDASPMAPGLTARASSAGRPGRRRRRAAARPRAVRSTSAKPAPAEPAPADPAPAEPAPAEPATPAASMPVTGSSTGSRGARPRAAPAAPRCWRC